MSDMPLPDILKKYDGIDDRTILILTAEKLDEHIAEHAATKRRMWTLAGLAVSAFVASITEGILSMLRH